MNEYGDDSPSATEESHRPATAEQRLKELGINLPALPEAFGTYVEAVQTGNLLFLSGMLPTEGHEAKFIGRIGAELDLEGGRQAARLAGLNALADVPNAQVHVLEVGHFALDTAADEIAELVGDFVGSSSRAVPAGHAG